MEHQWVRPVVTGVLCLVAAALLWYGAGVLFDRPPESDDAASLAIEARRLSLVTIT